MAEECALTVEPPMVVTHSGKRMIVGRGRISCSPGLPPKVAYIRLRKHRRLWTDKTLAEVEGIGPGEMEVKYECTGSSTIKVFTEVMYGNSKVKSGRVKVSLCRG
jgi:hypothetical protein